jgi:hypothetical protein
MTVVEIPPDIDLDVTTLRGYMAGVWDEDHPTRKLGFPIRVQVTRDQFANVSHVIDVHGNEVLYGMEVRIRGT